MIASVLHLDRKAVRSLKLTDAYSLHRVIYSLYPDVRSATEKASSVSSGILYADQGGNHAGRKVLMLADRFPAETVDGQYGSVQSKPVPGAFLDYERYRFKVIINPTRRDSATRKLIAVRGREAVSQWFIERAVGSWGFEVSGPHLQIDQMEVLQFKDKKMRQVTIGQAHIQGLLTVTDREQFKTSFSRGIGRARAYGCGLLQITPLIDNPFA